MGSLSSALNGLNLLHNSQAQQAHNQAAPMASQGQEPNWLPSGPSADNMMFYQNGNGSQNAAWADHRSGAML